MDAAKTVIPDLDALWMPFTANRQYKAAPRLLASASGMYYSTHDGRKVLDACAGLWCVAAGHCRTEITEAVARQVQTLDYAPPFQMGHPLAFEAATKVAGIMPAGLDRIFFTNSGSESVDTALKIALAYHRARGEGQRTRIIGRERGYHGVGFGGMAVGGIGPNRKMFSANLMPGTDHLPATLNIAEAGFSKGQPQWGAHLADDLERILALHDPSNVAAVIVEPLAGSAGVLVPPVGYLERLREITSKHGILLIFDEVITAFGRLGAATAAERFQVTPDLITMAKAINNAAVPMGAVAVKREVHDAVVNAAAAGAIELPHGYTYSAHPLACAAAIAALDIYARENLFGRAAALAPAFEAAVHGVRGAPHVKDIRNLGMVAGIELEPRAGQPGARGYEAFLKCLERGVLVRYTGDILAFSPPLIIDEAQIGEIFDTVRKVLQELA
ncbi:aspartate aminotransferase family protein [Cupriavidus sp. USMAHM13]|uniref:Aspartate aminotransferase family protein n=1 Tax=Cupriavidus malaysiensis TaxID=367825 RepID=A0ABN4TLP8_9BURK|nr:MULTISPECIES: aspartate aminotransferase family protein [Cupriavidus]AOY98509.1 aspartate aminotransferase family protein [Cupriavidus sp. USMAHM13]AOZ04939.1 aspartate aminotransferase family protein [Cupriavidus malaysiensis]